MYVKSIYNLVINSPEVGPLVAGGYMTVTGIKQIWDDSRRPSDEPRSYKQSALRAAVGVVILGASVASLYGLFSRWVGHNPRALDNATHCFEHQRPPVDQGVCPSIYDFSIVKIEPQLPVTPAGWRGWAKHVLTGR